VPRRIGGESIRFPARWCRYYPTDYEPATFPFLRTHCRPGSTVVDIGAHIGLFSVVMARCVGPSGRVLSFEPTPVSRKALRETIRLNNCAPIVEVREEAVAQAAGTAHFFFDAGDPVSNANSLVHGPRNEHSLTVPTVGMDELLESRKLSVSCLKIDAEGAEWDVLLGAERTFAHDRPAATLALHPAALRNAGRSLTDIWELLRAYRMSVRVCGREVTGDWFCEQTDLFDVQLLPL
jgi:FkbM family methyltransferase